MCSFTRIMVRTINNLKLYINFYYLNLFLLLKLILLHKFVTFQTNYFVSKLISVLLYKFLLNKIDAICVNETLIINFKKL